MGFLNTTNICPTKKTDPFYPTAAEQKNAGLEPEEQTHFHFLLVEGGRDVIGVQVSSQKPGRWRLLHQLRGRTSIRSPSVPWKPWNFKCHRSG